MKSVRLINHNFHKVCDVKAFFLKKIKNKLIRQLLLAVKKIIQERAQRHVAYCPITLRHDKQT